MSNQSPELRQRLAQGLSKIALAIRHGQQASAGPRGLSPTQAQILTIIASNRAEGLNLNWIADWLGVTAATVSDAVGTLQKKGLVHKQRSELDRRQALIALTSRGEQEARDLGLVPDIISQALECLDPEEQANLLRLVVKLIRQLQLKGQIPVARMCVTCQYFRPNTYADSAKPHHCAFVDAAFGDREQMIDCPDHKILPTDSQAVVWRQYLGRSDVPSS